MKYGNSLSRVAITRALAMAAGGFVLFLVMAIVVLGIPFRDAFAFVGVVFLSMLGIIAAISVFAYAECIDVSEGKITLRLFGRPIQTEYVSALVSVKLRNRSLFPVVFKFSNGSRIRFLGAHLLVIDAMIKNLTASVPLERVKRSWTTIEYMRR